MPWVDIVMDTMINVFVLSMVGLFFSYCIVCYAIWLFKPPRK